MEANAAAARRREAEIEKAIRSRVPDFKKQADSLTLEGVRRALEKDMGLEIYSLDAHKKFIKQCVDKVFSGSDDENTNNNASEKAETKDDHSSKEGSEDAQPVSGSNKISPSAYEQGARFSETEKDPEGQEEASGSDISEAMIKKAIDKRASYFRENSETLTLLGVRRTLEEDLKLEKKALDGYRSFITTELDEVLQEPANATTKNSKKESRKDADQKTSKGSKRAHQDSDTSEINDSHSEREDGDEDTRPKKRGFEKGKAKKRQKISKEEKKLSTRKAKKVAKRDLDKSTEDQGGNSAEEDNSHSSAGEGKAKKRQKIAKEEKKLSTPKAKKVAKRDLDKSTEEQGGNSAEEDNSHSSAEEDNKKKGQLAPAYGKRVEHLKSIIKSCGMSIAPSVYRRAKQAPESKREAWLIKELEDILEREGLSKNPSEKEIKAVKKRKERAKELEGIDMSNIITSSRRRSTSSFIPLPKPKIEADSDDDDAKDDGDDEENVEGGDEGDNDDAEAGDEAENERD